MERPILFNTEMTKAILEGRKTQTRRIVKPQPKESHTCKLGFILNSTDKSRKGNFAWGTNEHGGVMSIAKPPCQVGDTLWVRETWCRGHARNGDNKTIYKADIEELLQPMHQWKPSIHMPRKYARIFLKVTDVRVERLQDITEAAAIKEGCRGIECKKKHDYTKDERCGYCDNSGYIETPQIEFINLWDSIYSNWDDNPWVWVIEFERMV